MPRNQPNKPTFSRNRVINGILEEILNAGPTSTLQRAIAAYGKEWEESCLPHAPVIGASNLLWNAIADLGLVGIDIGTNNAVWTETAHAVFKRLNFNEPKDVQKAIRESNGKVVELHHSKPSATGEAAQGEPPLET